MKKLLVTLMMLFMFTVYYQHSPGTSSAVITNTGNWIQFSENGVFLSDSKPSNTLRVPVTQKSSVEKKGRDPEFQNDSIFVPANFKLFVPYLNLKAVERN